MNTKEMIETFGTVKELANAIGVTQSAVNQWGLAVPIGRRKSVRMALRERANELEAEAKRMRRAAKEISEE